MSRGGAALLECSPPSSRLGERLTIAANVEDSRGYTPLQQVSGRGTSHESSGGAGSTWIAPASALVEGVRCSPLPSPRSAGGSARNSARGLSLGLTKDRKRGAGVAALEGSNDPHRGGGGGGTRGGGTGEAASLLPYGGDDPPYGGSYGGRPSSTSGWKWCTSFDPKFVEDDTFQSFMGVIILANILVLWVETDHSGWLGGIVLDNLFVLVFTGELVLRILHHECAGYFCGKDKWWAFLDATVVCLGLVDALTMLLVLVRARGGRREEHRLLASLRLARLLRLLRVFRMFKKLVALTTALREMFGTFIWIFAILSMLLFTLAIIFTHLLGHGEAFADPRLQEEHEEALATIRANFEDVPTSLFTLFQLTTIDGWPQVADPLVEMCPWWRLFFVFFIAFTSWTVISVLTAVASHKMVNATADRKETEVKEQERKSLAFIEFLRLSFKEADTDGNGMLDLEEFKTMISQDFVHKRMKELGVHMSNQDLLKAWEVLDNTDSGEISIEEFVTGLSMLQEGLSTKHMVGVDYSVKRTTRQCERQMAEVGISAQEVVEESARLQHRVLSFSDLDSRLLLWAKWRARSEFGVWLRQHMPESSSS